MRNPNSFFNAIIALFAMGLIFTSCENDDDPKPNKGVPEDITIPIDNNSAFNMKNFIASFDQIFVANNHWIWNFSHDYVDGKASISYQNYKIYGKFGEKAFTITHTYNSDGIITSSERTPKESGRDVITFLYEYNTEGFIIKLTTQDKDVIRDIVTHKYNENNQLIKKTHLVIGEYDEEWEERFTYNSDGLVSIYEYRNGKHEYTYSNGNMVEEKDYTEEVLNNTDKYEYDGEGRVIKMNGDEDNRLEIQYFADMMVYLEYYNNLLKTKSEYGIELEEIKSYDYKYDDEDVFEYCRAKENDDEGKTLTKYYYEGSTNNFQLVGYSIIDNRDENNDNKKTKESVYSASGIKLYYVEFTLSDSSISETNWYRADGTSIEESDISESWVSVLVR